MLCPGQLSCKCDSSRSRCLCRKPRVRHYLQEAAAGGHACAHTVRSVFLGLPSRYLRCMERADIYLFLVRDFQLGESLLTDLLDKTMIYAPLFIRWVTVPFLMSYYFRQLGQERRDLVLDNIPQDLLIYAKIFMDGNITEPSYLTPLHLLMTLLHLQR